LTMVRGERLPTRPVRDARLVTRHDELGHRRGAVDRRPRRRQVVLDGPCENAGHLGVGRAAVVAPAMTLGLDIGDLLRKRDNGGDGEPAG